MMPYKIKTKVSPGVMVTTSYSDPEFDGDLIRYQTDLILSFKTESYITYPIAWTSTLHEAMDWHFRTCHQYQEYLI